MSAVKLQALASLVAAMPLPCSVSYNGSFTKLQQLLATAAIAAGMQTRLASYNMTTCF